MKNQTTLSPSTGGPVPFIHCETCGSEIVETVNDSVFGDGECDVCERARYESQPEIKACLHELIEAADCVADNWQGGDLACAVRYLTRINAAPGVVFFQRTELSPLARRIA